MKCLLCYKEVYSIETGEYHPRCSKQLFDTFTPPVLKYSIDEARTLAGSEAIFLEIQKFGSERRLSFSSEGSFFLRIPSPGETGFAELENTTLDLAGVLGLHIAPHGFARFSSGELGFISRRFDKEGSKPVEILPIGETEEAGRLITELSDAPGLDAVRFFERVVFSFITGCHDVNFAMFTDGAQTTRLCPAYDLFPNSLNTHQSEMFTLSLNGKKNNLTKNDFLQFATSIMVNRKSAENVFESFSEKIFDALGYMDKGLLTKDTIEKYRDFIKERASVISL